MGRALTPQVLAELTRLAGRGQVKPEQDMRPYTTMRVGGNAAALVEVTGQAPLSGLLYYLQSNAIPHVVLGNGSNMIVADTGYDGVVLHVADAFSCVDIHCDGLDAEAGASLAGVARKALDSSFAGLEFASGIPGTIGGAVAMNAGAYGDEMKDVVLTSWCLDTFGEPVVLQGETHCFGYRRSRIQDEGLVVVKTRLRLQKGDPEEILHRMQELSRRRAEKQPLHQPSAGSTFKRPLGYFSGQLIENCGLKGMRVGGAQVSEKHAGFIVNTGNATAEDVVCLVRMIREKVFSETGVLLEPEVKLLGGDQLCSF